MSAEPFVSVLKARRRLNACMATWFAAIIGAGTASANNAACWGQGTDDASRPEITCVKLTPSLIAGLAGLPGQDVTRTLDANGITMPDGSRFFLGNADYGLSGGTGHIRLTFADDRVSAVEADMDDPSPSAGVTRAVWTAASNLLCLQPFQDPGSEVDAEKICSSIYVRTWETHAPADPGAELVGHPDTHAAASPSKPVGDPEPDVPPCVTDAAAQRKVDRELPARVAAWAMRVEASLRLTPGRRTGVETKTILPALDNATDRVALVSEWTRAAGLSAEETVFRQAVLHASNVQVEMLAMETDGSRQFWAHIEATRAIGCLRQINRDLSYMPTVQELTALR